MSGMGGGQLPSFPNTGNNRDTGASRQIGEFGGYPVGQVDVRTDMMKQLEQSALPLLQQILGNPAGISQMFGQAAGPVPGIPQSGLSSLLFGGSTGQASPPQGGSGGGTGTPPGLPPGPPIPPAFPGYPQPLSPQGGWPTTPVAPGTGYNGGDGYNPLGSGGVLPAGTPIAGGPYTGLPAGAPMPTPYKYDKYGPGPIDETGSRFAESGASTSDFNHWAKSLGGKRPAEQTNASFKVPAGLESLFEGSKPTVGDAASMVGDLIKMSSRLREKNLTPEQSLAYANQLWATLPPEQQAHVARNSASIYAGGGDNPTLKAFFADKFKPGMGGGGTPDPGRLARADAISAEQQSQANRDMFARLNMRRSGIQSLAGGGIMDPNALKIVGEQGPELIAPVGHGQQAVMPLGAGINSMMAPGTNADIPLNDAPTWMPQPVPTGFELGDAWTPPGGPIAASGKKQPGKYHQQRLKRLAKNQGAQQYTGGLASVMAPAPAPGDGVWAGGSPNFDERLGQYTGGMPISIAPGSGPSTDMGMGQWRDQMPVSLAPGQQNTMPQAPAGPGMGNFASSPIQGQGTGMIERLLQQNPEMDAFNAGRNILMGQGGILGGSNAGQGIMQALQPLFQQNLKFGLNELQNSVPSVYNSAAAVQGADLTSRAMNDYNLLAAQAMMQGQQNQLGGLGMLGQLAGQAGGGQFGRAMQAGQLSTQRDLGLGSLGLQANQQQWNQTINPTLQLLLAAMGMATPTAYQTVVPGKK